MCGIFLDKLDIIDAGASIGDSSLVLSKLTSGKVYAFEPVESSYKWLEKITKLNNKNESIIPVKMALSNYIGNTKIGIYPFVLEGSSLLKHHECKTEDVEVTTVDEYVKNNKLNIGLIKTDVEGAETDLLNGAIETIKKYRPYLIISIYHTFKDFFHIKPFIENLNLNYELHIIRMSPSNCSSDIILFCKPK